MLLRVSILTLALAAVLVGTVCSIPASAAEGDAAKLRICVADFRPEKGTVLNDRELDYCKMLQRGVEDELVQWYEVEESTRYGSIAKELASMDSAQAATALGEKAGVHQVVTGLVTKVGTTIMVQCHFVQVPRAGQEASETTNKVLRSVNASFKVGQEDDWVELLRILQAKVSVAITGKEVKTPVAPKIKVKLCKATGMCAGPNCRDCATKELAPDAIPDACTLCKGATPGVKVKLCKATGMCAGPNCSDCTTKELAPDSVPDTCTLCKAAAPGPTPDEIRLMIAQALRAIDENKLGDAASLADQVTKADTANGEAWYIRGVIQFFQKKYGEAEKNYLRAIELGYDRAAVRDDLANVYWNLAAGSKKPTGYMDRAIEQAYKSLSLAPGNPWAYNTIGCVTFQMAVSKGKDRAKLKVAADSLTKAAELLTSDPQLLDNAANALAQLDELSEAEQYAKRSLAAAEKNKEPYPNAYETLSKIYTVKGDKESAKRYHELYRKAAGG